VRRARASRPPRSSRVARRAARLNAALAKIRNAWDFHGWKLSEMGKRTVVSLLHGAVNLRSLDLSYMDLEGDPARARLVFR